MKHGLNLNGSSMLPVLLLSLLSAGCTTPAPVSTGHLMTLPSPPPAQQPAPPQPYSASAAQHIEMWQQRLTDTLPTPNSAEPRGRSEP